MDFQLLLKDSTLNVVDSVSAIDAAFAAKAYPGRFSIVSLVQANVPQSTAAVEGPSASPELAHRVARPATVGFV